MLEQLDKLKNIISFYRDCYQIDLKGTRIKNFVSNQCEKRLVPTTNSLFHEDQSRIPVSKVWAKEVDQVLFINSKEKILYAGSIFIKGKQHTLGSRKTAFVPLYIHELHLFSEMGEFFVSVTETYFNPDFIELANSMDDRLNMNLDTLSNHAPLNPFGDDNFKLLKTFFDTHFNSWNSYDLKNYQDAEFNFKNYFTRSSKIDISGLRLLSCLMFGVFKKPEGSLGILNELNYLSKNIKKSSVLDLFFNLKEFDFLDLKKRHIYLPTTLSNKQESAFYASDVHPITQIIGPPGTGKSFTIAALAIDAISNNKSVLIVTRNTQACKVITNIIENDFMLKGTVIKAYNQVYKRGLSSKLRNSISVKPRRNDNPKQLLKLINSIQNKIERVEEDIISIEHDELKWGTFYSEYQDTFFSKFKDKWFQYQKSRTQPIEALNKTLKGFRKEKTRLVKKYIKVKIQHDLYHTIRSKKVEFLKLNAALKEKNITLLDKKLKQVDFKLVLEALPLWATTTKEISKCIPLQHKLFDLVIFDESSQCDIASSIPVLHRAKKAVVVGDPHQLRHISFLSKNKQAELRQKHSVLIQIPDYRNDSLIDWTDRRLSNPEQTIFLDEHFRSKTDLIQFSNQNIYDGQLKLIRSNPISDLTSSIEIVKTSGIRSEKGINETEAKLIIEKIKEITNAYIDFDKTLVPTIGIISPFTHQVQFLKRELSKHITFDLIKKHKILVGTPFHFQGEERDIILISFCIDAHVHFGSINYLNRKDVFNVLVTRAKNRQLIYTSLESSSLPPNSLLKEYLEFNNVAKNAKLKDSIYDQFLIDVSNFLKQKGFDLVYPSIIVSGVLIDLVVVHNGNYYCIDLIGYPGEFEEQFSLENLRILNRMDTPIFFLPYSSWYLNKKEAKENLVKFFQIGIDYEYWL